jgi:CRISPR-associated protein Csx17
VPLPTGRLDLPARFVGRLTAGHVDEVVAAALLRARSAGLATPFATHRPGSADSRQNADPGRQNADQGRRLAAALLIPLNDAGLARVIARAYPTTAEDSTAEDPEKETSRVA